jgi:protein-S-isoprenylcysteine O-methyltransferase Ste14
MRENRLDPVMMVAVKQLIVVSVLLGMWMLVFLASAGYISVRAWVFLGASFLHSSLGVIVQYKLNPQLLAVRLTVKRSGSKLWDEVLMRVTNLTAIIAVPAFAGLDVGRFHWSTLGPWFVVVGLVLFAISTVLLNWAMVVNPHFEATVRIQTDRGHKVITGGPYKFIRHPGYLAGIIYIVSVPLVVGSVFSSIPVGLYIIFIMLRTSLEDRTLGRELDGYASYAEHVRYRLFLGIW